MHPAGHLDGAAEGDLAIALAEVQVAHAQTGAVHIDGEEHLGTARQILDVAVAAMLARRHGACAFGGGLVARLALHLAHVGGGGVGRVGQAGDAVGVGGDEAGLALIPAGQHLGVGQAADQSRVDEACEVDAGDVAALGEHAVEVPDGLLGQREMLVQEAAAVLLGEKAVEAPEAVVARADVQQVHHQQVAGLGALDAHGAGQEVDGGQVHVAHVFGAVVVLDGAAGPVIGLQLELRARLHPDRHGDVGMPAVVHLRVVVGGLVEIDLDQGFGHGVLLAMAVGKNGSDGEVGLDALLVGICSGRLMDQAPALDDEQPVGHIHGEGKHLLADHDGDAAQLADLVERLGDVLDDGRLYALGGLVQQQHLGVGDQRARNGQLLLLPAREVAALAPAHVPEHGEQGVDVVGHLARLRVLQARLYVLFHGQRGEDHAALGHVGNALGHAPEALVLRDVLAGHGDLAALGGHDAHQAFEQRGLAHAVAAHDGHGFVLAALEADAVQRLALAIGHVQILDLQHVNSLCVPQWPR